MDNINKWALGWSVLWVVLAVLLIAQLVLLSIPDGDALLIGIDLAAITFVAIRLKNAVAILKRSDEPPGPKDR